MPEDQPRLRTATSLLLTTQRAAPRQALGLIYLFSVFSPSCPHWTPQRGEPCLQGLASTRHFFGSLKGKVVFASHIGWSPLNPVFPHSWLPCCVWIACQLRSPLDHLPSSIFPLHMLTEKQIKYFFYHQFPLFMYLPTLIISEESYQRSNRLLKWWFGPQMIHGADNLLIVR